MTILKKRLIFAFIFLFLFITACNKEDNAVISNNNDNVSEWYNNTKDFIVNSYTQIGLFGGYSSNLNFRQEKSKKELDLNNSAWYLKTLGELDYTKEISASQKKILNSKLHELFFKEDAVNEMSTIYYYWLIICIYDELKIPIPQDIRGNIINYINSSINDNGIFTRKEHGINGIDATIISVRVKKILKMPDGINKKELYKMFSRDILTKKSEVDSLAILISELDMSAISTEMNSKLKKYYSNEVKGFDWSNNTIDNIYIKKMILDRLKIPYKLPDGIINRFQNILNQQLQYKQYPHASFTYELIYIISTHNIDRKNIIKFIEAIYDNDALWTRPYSKQPELQNTYYSVTLNQLLSIRMDESQINAIHNYYTQMLNSPEIKYIPYLYGIYLYLQENESVENQFEINKYNKDAKNLSVDQESVYFRVMMEVYNLYKKPFDSTLEALQNDIAKKTKYNIEEIASKNGLNILAGILIAQKGELNQQEVEKIVSRYLKKNGFSENGNSNSGDIIGNYLVSNVDKEYGIKFPKDIEIEKYRIGGTGYSLYPMAPEWYSLEFTYYGFLAEKNILEMMD